MADRDDLVSELRAVIGNLQREVETLREARSRYRQLWLLAQQAEPIADRVALRRVIADPASVTPPLAESKANWQARAILASGVVRDAATVAAAARAEALRAAANALAQGMEYDRGQTVMFLQDLANREESEDWPGGLAPSDPATEEATDG